MVMLTGLLELESKGATRLDDRVLTFLTIGGRSRYRDGFTNEVPVLPKCENGETKNCTFREIPHSVETGYSDAWYARIVADSDNAEVGPPLPLRFFRARHSRAHPTSPHAILSLPTFFFRCVPPFI